MKKLNIALISDIMPSFIGSTDAWLIGKVLYDKHHNPTLENGFITFRIHIRWIYEN